VRGEGIPELVAARRHDADVAAADAEQLARHVADGLVAQDAQRAGSRRRVLQVPVHFRGLRLAELRVPVIDRRSVGIEQLALDDAEPPVFAGQLDVVLDQHLAPRQFGHQRLHLGLGAEGADVLQLVGHDARALAERLGVEGARGALLGALLYRAAPSAARSGSAPARSSAPRSTPRWCGPGYRRTSRGSSPGTAARSRACPRPG
jgi:hypothetical protein